MAKNDYTKMITAQIEAFIAMSLETLGEDHRTITILRDTVEQLNDALTVLPNGFENDDTFEEFMDSQAQTFPDMTGNELLDAVDDVVGEIVNEAGETVEVGDVQGSMDKVNELIQEAELEQGEELNVSDIMRINYERLDGSELTANHVDMILKHPASNSLKHLGTIQLLTIEDSDEASAKTAIFVLENDGVINKKALASRIVAYRGVLPFPGIGQVQCTSSVAFADGEAY